MKNFSSFSNSKLVADLKLMVKTERDTVVEILWHLREVEQRRIHLDSGFPSLFEYCTEELGYSAGAAARRIASMRLLKELPEIEPKIKSGELQISQLAQAQNHFRQEKKEGHAPAPEQKLEILQSLEGKSARETERILVSLNPKNIPTEKARPINEELTEIRFVASSELMNKIEEAKYKFSHALPDAGIAALFERLLDEALKKKAPKADSVLRPTSESESESKSKPESPSAAPAHGVPGAHPEAFIRKPIPLAVRRQVVARAGGCCEYRDAHTQRRCGSRYQVQVDHVVSVVKGGNNAPDNLRLLCRQHNLREAEKIFGENWMMQFRGTG